MTWNMRIIKIWIFLILSLILIGCENKEKGTDQYPKTVYNDKYDNAIIMINDSIMVIYTSTKAYEKYKMEVINIKNVRQK